MIGKAGKLYRQAVAGALKRLGVALVGRIGVEVVYLPATIHQQLDLDNLCKCLLDSLTHAGIWKDDAQVDDLRLLRGPVSPPGLVSLTVREL